MGIDTEPGDPAQSVSQALAVLEQSPAERDEAGITDAEVEAALRTVIERGDETDKRLGDVTLPAIDFAYEVLDGENNHPLDLSGATIESLDVTRTSLRVPLLLDGATVGRFDAEDAHFERDVSLEAATLDAAVATEAVFRGEVVLTDATVRGAFRADKTDFEDDTDFDGVAFRGEVCFDAATLYGASERRSDNVNFRGTTFGDDASFHQTTLGFADFGDTVFEREARFVETTVEGDAEFDGATFAAAALFDECTVLEDADFSEATFGGTAQFRGGAKAIEDDLTFADATFDGEADFTLAEFRYADFSGVTFREAVTFEGVAFAGDADFLGTEFEAFADFDEARFGADADFSEATFRAACDFRGAEFHGGDNHLDVAATFRSTTFEGDADFDNALFTTAVFEDVRISDVLDFRDAVFEESFTVVAKQLTNGAYVDFSGATLREGEIRQPEGGWVRYDLTEASLGAVELAAPTVDARRELLDYFRLCETEFDEFDGYDFDFSAHTDYFDRNDWVLHDFETPVGDYDPPVAMTPETIERTYLKAKIAASSVGNQQAAGEFRVKRQEHARRKYLGIVGDGGEDLPTRFRNGARAVENRFLGITCGHGLRLTRILVVFALFPLLPALLYTYGGMLPGVSPEFFATTGVIEDRTVDTLSEATSDSGVRALYANLAFAYITFLTVGYGNASPQGGGANVLAAASVYISVILGGLVLYALIKRSEV